MPPLLEATLKGSAPSDTAPAVALMFLTVGEVKNPDVWAAWLQDVPKERWNIYVHAKEPDSVKHPLFESNLVRAVKTKWGTVSLVKAHITLIKQALRNKNNRWFILLSDSCLPLVGFSALAERLRLEYQMSSFDLHTPKAQKVERENIRSIMSDVLEEVRSPKPKHFAARCDTSVLTERETCMEIAATTPEGIGCEGAAVETGDGNEERAMTAGGSGKAATAEESLIKQITDHDDLTAHSQWCVLTRNDAETLTQGSDLEVWYRAYKHMLRLDLVKRSYLLAPDELFVLTYLRHHHRTNGRAFPFQNRKSTFAHCCLDMVNCECSLVRAAHPMSFQALRKELVLHAFVARSLFARKFDAGMKISDFEALWGAMECEPNQVLEVAELSSALANPERLTQRQQLTIAMKLSRSGQRDQRRQTPPVHHGADSALASAPSLSAATVPLEESGGAGRQGGGGEQGGVPEGAGSRTGGMPPRKHKAAKAEKGKDTRGSAANGDGLGEGQAVSDESDFYEFSEVDVGAIVEIDCGEDGMLAARLQRHIKDEVFLVRFTNDNNELEVNLGLTNCRVKDGASSCRHGIGGKMASQEGAGGTGKRRRETGKRKTTASKWKLWEEEESKKSVGSMLSREERKAMAVWQQFQALDRRDGRDRSIKTAKEDQPPVLKSRASHTLSASNHAPDSEQTALADADSGEHETQHSTPRLEGTKERVRIEKENTGKNDYTDHTGAPAVGGRGGWEDAVASEVKSDLSREERQLQQQLEMFKKIATNGGRGGAKAKECKGAGQGAGRQGLNESHGTGREEKEVPQESNELTREERKMRQQLELFEKMEAQQKEKKEGERNRASKSKDSCSSSGLRGGAEADGDDLDPPPARFSLNFPLLGFQSKYKQQFAGKAVRKRRRCGVWQYLFHYNGWGARYDEWLEEDLLCPADQAPEGRRAGGEGSHDEMSGKLAACAGAPSEVSSSGGPKAVGAHGVLNGVSVGLEVNKSQLSREDRKMMQQLELFKKMEAERTDKAANARARLDRKDSSSSEDETSEDEEVTEATPKPKFALEELVLAKYGSQFYLGKPYEVERKVNGWRYLIHYTGWGARYDNYVYEKDMHVDNAETRARLADKLNVPKIARKIRRDEGEGTGGGAVAKKHKNSEGSKEGDDKSRHKSSHAKGASMWDAVTPEVKSELTREERKLQAEMARITKLEAKANAEAAAVRRVQGVREEGSVGKEKLAPGPTETVCVEKHTTATASTATALSTPGASTSPGDWPVSAYMLRKGVNDSWNSFQAANRGKQVSVAEWKAKRQQLHDRWEELIAKAGPKERMRLLHGC